MTADKPHITLTRAEFDAVLELQETVQDVLIAESARRRVSTLTPNDADAIAEVNLRLYHALTHLYHSSGVEFKL
ncbi:hypothetical protein FYJ43_07595 [Cutibacterium sp. WCA-380-WT-3A]|uniref:Uncharacterized protein n=1 Tax=Cutibacterium porci TaxID=2605781 RepID=A0A7K0J7G6_9ACTN|nr:hypothetical protein [Cutibacterium porci]MSS45901.1 hypothetical protein [Cutibacterium porci]